tara:strand:+ start:644 stop:1096 length:453 start_codon:yes stop_codon:yes gene_type:complete
MSQVSELQVMKSAAGYYIGRGYNDMGSTGYPFPYSRESGYYPTAQLAQTDLDYLVAEEAGDREAAAEMLADLVVQLDKSEDDFEEAQTSEMFQEHFKNSVAESFRNSEDDELTHADYPSATSDLFEEHYKNAFAEEIARISDLDPNAFPF